MCCLQLRNNGELKAKKPKATKSPKQPTSEILCQVSVFIVDTQMLEFSKSCSWRTLGASYQMDIILISSCKLKNINYRDRCNLYNLLNIIWVVPYSILYLLYIHDTKVSWECMWNQSSMAKDVENPQRLWWGKSNLLIHEILKMLRALDPRTGDWRSQSILTSFSKTESCPSVTELHKFQSWVWIQRVRHSFPPEESWWVIVASLKHALLFYHLRMLFHSTQTFRRTL